MWQVVSGVFLGWSLGSNDAANVFGTAVASRMVRFGTAAILASIFVILGSVLQGQAGIATYSSMSHTTLDTAFLVSLAAAVTVTIMTLQNLPVSTSQAVVGALALLGVEQGDMNWPVLLKVAACWVGTPIGAALFAVVIYFMVGKLINRLHLSMFQYDRYLRMALVVAGCYGAYALGANNVANVIGPFVGEGMLTPFWGTLIGGASIAFGIMTFSKKVMMTVGKGLVRLDAYAAFVVVLAEALTVHVYAEIGVPVSTSQAVVGAVLGIGLLKGVQTIQMKTLVKILFGWLGTPTISFGITFLLYRAMGYMAG